MVEARILNEILAAGMFFGLIQFTYFVYGVVSTLYIA